jgi:hypothetical protein
MLDRHVFVTRKRGREKGKGKERKEKEKEKEKEKGGNIAIPPHEYECRYMYQSVYQHYLCSLQPRDDDDDDDDDDVCPALLYLHLHLRDTPRS